MKRNEKKRKEKKRKKRKEKKRKKKKKLTTLCGAGREQGLPPPVLQGMLVSPSVQPSALLLGFDTPAAIPKSEKKLMVFAYFCRVLSRIPKRRTLNRIPAAQNPKGGFPRARTLNRIPAAQNPKGGFPRARTLNRIPQDTVLPTVQYQGAARILRKRWRLAVDG